MRKHAFGALALLLAPAVVALTAAEFGRAEACTKKANQSAAVSASVTKSSGCVSAAAASSEAAKAGKAEKTAACHEGALVSTACTGKTAEAKSKYACSKSAAAHACSKSAGATATAAGYGCTKAGGAKSAAVKSDKLAEIAAHESSRIVLSGNLGCGRCTFDVSDACRKYLETADGKLYPLLYGVTLAEMTKVDTDRGFKIVTRVKRLDGVKYLDVESFEVL